ncbi:MAG: SDR family NAD(P)-dependent oxidoreductase [Solirubrobacteraceae bacterium]
MSAEARVALVTGASSGIGLATAQRLARDPGAELILVARRGERLRELAESLRCQASFVAVDLTAEEAPALVLAHVAERGGRLHLLVNNAGAAWRGGFAETGYANVRRHMEINFDAVVRLTEALLPSLRDSAPSAIVNVASTAARVSRARSGGRAERYAPRPYALAAGARLLAPRLLRRVLASGTAGSLTTSTVGDGGSGGGRTA